MTTDNALAEREANTEPTPKCAFPPCQRPVGHPEADLCAMHNDWAQHEVFLVWVRSQLAAAQTQRARLVVPSVRK